MKGFMVLAICLAPGLVLGQQTYTNEDLAKFQLPGAYSNEDLSRIGPLAVQKEPASRLPEFVPPPSFDRRLQADFDSLRERHRSILSAIVYEQEQVEYSESAFAGDTRDATVRLGHRTPASVWIRHLSRQAKLLEMRVDRLVDDARRAGVTLDRD